MDVNVKNMYTLDLKYKIILQNSRASYKMGYSLTHNKVKMKLLGYVWLFATPWTVAYRAPLSMGFSKQEYWSGLPFPSPGDLPDPGIEPGSPAL